MLGKPLQVQPRYRWTVKRRLRILAYVKAHSLKAASRHFGLDRKTIRQWRDRCEASGLLGLVPFAPGVRGLVAAVRARGGGDPPSPAVATGWVSVAAVIAAECHSGSSPFGIRS